MFVRVPNGLKLALVCAFAFTARSAFAQPPQLVTTIDLGVLPGQIFAQAQAVSPNGTVAGMTYGSDYIRHIFLWKQASGMIDLGGGYPDVQVTGVNDQGLVVGSVLASDYQRYVFRATAGSSPTLDPMPCVDYCDRVGLNASGQVVGSHYGVNGAQHAFVWSLTTNPIDLPFTPGAIGARATAINDAGQITGSFLLTTSPDPNVLTAALWTPNGSVYTAEDLGRFSDQSGGTAINAAGTIIGSYGDSSGNFVKGFKWTRSGGMVDLSASTANVWILWASGIAPGGLIAGGVSDANYSQYAFIYKDGVGLRRLSNPAGIAGASAAAIDSFGLTSGAGSAASGSHAVAWQSCQSLDVHPAGFGHSRIQAANDSSFAVGWVASDDYSVFHAFAWQFAHPGPPPPTPRRRSSPARRRTSPRRRRPLAERR